MAESLLSPPESRDATPEHDNHTNDHLTRLDSLLERYLELLDEYTTLRDNLSNAFSSGFFSLAQAQRSSSLGAGRRYGEDCYDERMKANRCVQILSLEENEDPKSKELAVTVAGKKQPDERLTLEGTSTQEMENSKHNREAGDSKDLRRATDSFELKDKPKDKNIDPLKWFGVLVPPALRQTQSHFTHAVENVVPKLISLNIAMENLERDIRHTRSELGDANDDSRRKDLRQDLKT